MKIYHDVMIGNVKLKGNVIVPPMAGVTNAPFRYILNKYAKPSLIFVEMVNARAVVFNDQKTMDMLNTYENESPIAFQIFGDNPKIMGEASKILSKRCDILDINMGCPAPKIVRGGGGSDLLKDLDRAKKIIDEVVKNSCVPVTLKLRLGWDRNNIVVYELAKYAQEAGIKALTIHGRTRSEQYLGHATYDEIKKVKEIVNIPVFANGDIIDIKSAKEVLEYTKADGVAIARATLASPYKLRKIVEKLKGKNYTIEKNIVDIIKEQYEYLYKLKGEVASREIRKYVIWYSDGIKNSKKIRADISKIVDRKSLDLILERLKEEIEND